jgi:hypothetical protein
VRDPSGLPVHDAELEPEDAGAGLDRLVRVRDAQPGAPEDVDHLERARRGDRLSEAGKGGDPEHLNLVGVDRDAIEPLPVEEAEDAEGWTGRVGRRPDHGDPTGRPKGTLDPGVVEDGDRPAPLFEIEELGRLLTLPAARLPGLVLRQVAASRSYGCPSAAGGMLRPTTPARITMVTR